MERSKICEAMVFAVDNADSASEVQNSTLHQAHASFLSFVVDKGLFKSCSFDLVKLKGEGGILLTSE